MKRPMTVVYVAAQEDELLRQKLERHLTLLEQQGLMQGWYIQQIPAGSVQVESRDAALQNASLVLLLISADFFASSVCQEQMQRVLERQKRGEVQVIPILLRRVDGKGAMFSHLQALPTNGKPIAIWANEDEALAEVAKGIRRVIEGAPLPRVKEMREVGRDRIGQVLYEETVMTSQQPGSSPNFRGRWIILCLVMFGFVALAIRWINAPSSQLSNTLAIIGTTLGLVIGIFQWPYFHTPLEGLLHRLEAFLNKYVQIHWGKAIAVICSLVALLIALLLFLPTLPGLNAKLTLPPSGWPKTYQDPLNAASKSKSMWDISGNGCQFQEQSLVLTSAGPDFCESRAVFLSSNFYLRITLQIATGNEAGVIVDTTQKNCSTGPRIVFFYASITTDGHYKLMYYGCKGETRILKQGSSPAIQQGNNTVNYLGILRIGSKLSLFANDDEQPLTSVSSNETQQLKTGRIGLAVTDYFKEKDFTVALFRDVIIYEPGSSS